MNQNLQGAVVLHCKTMSIDVLGNQKNKTQDSNVVPHLSNNWA